MKKCTICGTEEKLLLFGTYCPNEENHLQGLCNEVAKKQLKEYLTTAQAQGIYRRFWTNFTSVWGDVNAVSRARVVQSTGLCVHEDHYFDQGFWWCFACGSRQPDPPPGATLTTY